MEAALHVRQQCTSTNSSSSSIIVVAAAAAVRIQTVPLTLEGCYDTDS